MSNQLGTSRAMKSNKEKVKSAAMANQASQNPSFKTEKPVPKNQATVEQMRMALMIDSGKETANIDTVKHICEMTGRSEDDVIVALHDARDDAHAAVILLLEGEQGQGEWEVQDKKKKRSSTLKSEKDLGSSSVPENDRGDPRSDRSRDRHDFDRHDGPPRRGRDRRNGGPPPRLANRGRGRDRNSYRGDRDRDRGGFGGRGNFNDQNDRGSHNEADVVNGEEDWDAEVITNDFKEQRTSSKDFRDQRRSDKDRGFGGDRERGFGGDQNRSYGGDRDRDRGYGGDRDRSFGGDRDRGFGGDRDRSFGGERDRGRGFGGNRGRGRGRGGFGRPNSRGGRPRRFDRNDSSEGPHIDTWTNETAENAEKETSGWGETWAESTEDWCEDQWTGSLEDTKVFTSSQTKTTIEADLATTVNDASNTIGQRLDVGSLFSKSAEFAKAPDFTKTGEPTSGESFFATFNQQATESIKNTIGIGSSSARQNLSNMPVSAPQSLGTLPAMPQRELSHAQPQPPRSSVPSMLSQSTSSAPSPMHASSTSSAPPAHLPPTSVTAPSASVSTPPMAQPTQPQQRRQQRSKLPPPSKIPASAVEMPGHSMPQQLDVQFGVDFGAESSQYAFGPTAPSNNAPFSSSSSVSNSSLTNHLGETSKGQEVNRQVHLVTPSPAQTQTSQSPLPNMESAPARTSVFGESVYASPSKSESPAKVESVSYQSPAPEHKPVNLMNSSRSSQSSSTMSQGSLSASKQERDTSSMVPLSLANGYAASSYPTHSSHSQSHKASSSSSQTYRQAGPVSQTSGASYPNQYSSQTQYSGAGSNQQNQYPSPGQAQFPGSQGQFPSAGSTGSSAPTPSQYMASPSQYPSGSQSSFPQAPVASQGQYQAGGNQYHSNYQSSSVSFQSQPSAQSGQNPLYPSTTQQSGGSYPSGSNSFHVRDSQSTGNMQQSVVNLQQAAGNLQPSVVNLQQPSGNLQQSVGTLAAPAVSQPNNSYQNQQPAPGLTKATSAQNTNAYNTQTYSGSHASPTTTQTPNAYSSQTYSNQPLHNQATTTQSPSSYNTQQTFSTQHSSQHAQATTTQSPSAYNTQTFSAQHAPQQNLQTSPLGNKLGDSLSKMTIKESASIESRTSQYDHVSNSSTTVSLTSSSSTANSSSISTSTSTVSATSTPVVTTSTLASRVTTSIPLTTKAPPNLPPGVPLMNPHLFMGQAAAAGGLPPYFAGLQGLQQPLYGYEELQMMQPARLPLQTGNFYDIAAYSGVPSTIAAGRDQAAALGTAPYTGAATDNKQMNRVEAQSPSQSTQQQSTHSAPQQTLPFNIHYSYYYPGVLPGAAGFQYPTMFPMPPVTNTAAAHVPGTTTAAQLPKTYGSHQGFPSKGTGTTADINTGAYAKSHAQGFDKQGFPAGTPPPFSLPLANASQAGPLGAPTAPFGTPFLPMMPPQAHNQTLLHHPLPQDSGTGSNRGLQQPTNQGKPAAPKNNYYSSWN